MAQQLSRKCGVCDREQALAVFSHIALVPVIDLDDDVCDECIHILAKALKAIRQARTDGNHYEVASWRDPIRDNLEHALTHIFKYKRGDTTEGHIAHAICNLVFEYAKQ